MVQVTKADGSREDYSEQKVRSSLMRAGAGEHIIKEIVEEINREVNDGMSTQDIYSLIYNHLRDKDQILVSRYNLKSAIMELGPTGYPFEKFFAGVLQQYGYTAETNVILQGSCVTHEIDILAEKDGKRIMIEAKFHNHPGTKSDIRATLYTHARFLDVKEKNDFDEHWLVTNTKATHDAVSYGLCRGMKVISWDKPDGFSLRHLIEKSRLHPITALEHLSEDRKRELLEKGIVFVKDMKE